VQKSNQQPSKPQFSSKAAPKTNISPVRTLIRLMLDDPGLIQRLPDIDFTVLANSPIPGLPLLFSVFQFCKQNPSAHTGSVLEHFRGNSEEKHLAKLLQQEFLIDDNAAQQVFVDSFKKLLNWHFEQRMDVLLSKARVSGLSADEKQELNLLTQAKKR
jgi:DNA primase